MMVLWGFYSPEDWGVWTRDPTARVYFDTAVSGSVRIKIKGLAYGPNHGKLIKVKVGTVEQQGCVQLYRQRGADHRASGCTGIFSRV